jgi:hypothetical protein
MEQDHFGKVGGKDHGHDADTYTFARNIVSGEYPVCLASGD